MDSEADQSSIRTDNGYDGKQHTEQYFRYYDRDAMNERVGRVEAWKNLA